MLLLNADFPLIHRRFSVTTEFSTHVCDSLEIWNNGFSLCAPLDAQQTSCRYAFWVEIQIWILLKHCVCALSFRLLSIYYRNNMHCYCSKCIANNHHIVHNGYIIHANLFSMRLAKSWRTKLVVAQHQGPNEMTKPEKKQTTKHFIAFALEIS